MHPGRPLESTGNSAPRLITASIVFKRCRQNSAYSPFIKTFPPFFVSLMEVFMKLSNDPFVLELLPEFVDTWLADLENLSGIISSRNPDELYRFAHTLKGSCFQFGLDHIAQMGIELMGYAKSLDWDNALAMQEKIRISFLEVKNYLENNLNK